MGKKKKVDKTNAIRILTAMEVPHHFQTYDVEDGKIDGVSVADKIHMPYAQVFKTLVARSSATELFVFVIPVDKALDLKKAAQTVGVKKIEMIHVKELLPLTGYQKGGCSPIGMKKTYPTVIDSTCEHQDVIVVSAGKIGLQLVLRPTDLLAVIHGQVGDITRED